MDLHFFFLQLKQPFRRFLRNPMNLITRIEKGPLTFFSYMREWPV